MGDLERAALVTEITDRKRGRAFQHRPCLALLQDELPAASGAEDLEGTEPSVVDSRNSRAATR
jgi:hypothetical protein